jgi:hypothetical protein
MFFGSFSPSWIRIRIRILGPYRIRIYSTADWASWPLLLLGLLGLLEKVLEGEGLEEVALTLVELGLELHPVQPEHDKE